MKSELIIDYIKEGNIVIPVYFLKNYKNFKLELNEFVFLMYLCGNGDTFVFNPDKISKDMGMELPEVLELISVLTDKGFISVNVLKNDKDYMEDIISLDGFYNKVKLMIVEDANKSSDHSDATIFDFIESEFGRTLSSIEYEIISAWLDNNMSEDLIKEAVKEAVLNGVSNLKYIDKILYEWGKKGFKTIKDVEDNRKKRNAERDKKSSVDSDIDLDIVDWNWFDEDE